MSDSSQSTSIPAKAARSTGGGKPSANALLNASPIHIDGFTAGLTTAFFTINLLMVLNHAMWRDEWWVWQAVRVPSISQVYATMNHSGHPFAWFFLAWVCFKLGTYPWGLKLVFVAINTTYIFLSTRYAPFSRVQKLLFAFSYYPLFEYGGILRDYAPEMLGVIVSLILFSTRPRRPIWFGVAIALLATTSVFGVLLGIALGIGYLFDIWYGRDGETEWPSWKHLAIGMGVAIAAMLLTYLHTRPVPGIHDPFIRQTPFTAWLMDGIEFVWRAYVPIPEMGQWNTNFLDQFPMVELVLGGLIVVGTAILLAPRPTALVFYLSGVAILYIFSLVFWGAGVRHQGHLFIAFIMAAWIHSGSRAVRLPTGRIWQRMDLASSKLPLILTVLLAIHSAVAAIFVTREQTVPFSGSREAAWIIQNKAPANVPVIGDIDYAVAPVSGYLDRPIYIPYREMYCTYQIENSSRRLTTTPPAELQAAAQKLMSETHGDVVILLNYPLEIDYPNAELIGVVNESMVGDEKYTIYLIHNPFVPTETKGSKK